MAISLADKNIATSFSTVAESYATWAEPQRRMAERLTELLPEKIPAGGAVDLCCGTGMLANLLHEKYPDTHIQGIDIAPGMIELCRNRWLDNSRFSFALHNAEEFIASEPCALIACNCGFQWFRNPAKAVQNLANSLKPGGILAVSVPVDGSLPELRESYQHVTGNALGGIGFLQPEQYVKMIESTGLRCKSVRVTFVSGNYDSAWDALRYFKHTGTTFRHHDGYKPLSVLETRRLLSYYDETFSAENSVPVTYRMVYIIAEKTR